MIIYDGLERELAERNTNKSKMAEELGISSRTIAKIAKGEKLADHVMERITGYLNCDESSLYREVSSNKLLQLLRDEKSAGISGGLYHELQIRMTYNSNHIEGSTLTEDQTRMIFETNTLDVGDGVPIDDILETVHHFRAIDYCIDVAEEELTEHIIKQLHYIIKHDTRDARLPWFAIGDYKKRPNFVGGKATAKPVEVEPRLVDLIRKYNAIENPDINDIIEFHVNFERIHPFQDGNGRVGRLIAFKECLRHEEVPFIIEDYKKAYYYRGLAEWDREQGYLTDTCLDGQDTVKALLKELEIEYE